MKTQKLLLIAGFIIVVSFTAAAQAVTLKIATLAPPGSSWMDVIKQGADQISNDTSERVKFKFYPGASWVRRILF